MLALPFDLESLEHRLYVVDATPAADAAERLRAELAGLDRSRIRATVVSIGGPYQERNLVKGLGLELVEMSPGSVERRGPWSRLRHLRKRLGELRPDRLHLLVRQGALLWKVAASLSRRAPAFNGALPAGARDRQRIAFVLKSDLGRPMAHVRQAIHTAGALAARGARVELVAPLEAEGEDAFRTILEQAGVDPQGLVHHRIKPLSRSLKTRRALLEVLSGLAADGCGTLYFRQARIASMLLPDARRLGLRVFMEAHQPYATWALNERRRLWADHPGGEGDKPLSAMARLDRQYEARCYRELDGVLCTTRAMLRRVRRLAPHCPTLLLRNGAPEPLDPDQPVDPAERSIDLLYAGKISAEKGTDVLIRALAQTSDIHLTLVGGPTEEHLQPYRELARKIGVEQRIEFLPWESQERLFRRMRGARLAVHPLSGRGSREWRLFTCPLKILECMALGVPVVASDLPAIREILRDGRTGRLVPPGNSTALAHAIAGLLADPAQADRIRGNALRRARAWSHQRRAGRLHRFLMGSEREQW